MANESGDMKLLGKFSKLIEPVATYPNYNPVNASLKIPARNAQKTAATAAVGNVGTNEATYEAAVTNNTFSTIRTLSRMFILRMLACLLVAAFLFGSVEAAAPTGVFVWYKANNNFLDFTSNTSATVIPLGAMLYAPGRVLQAFNFDGATALKINETPGNLNFGTGNFTIAAWVKFTSTSKAPVIYQNGYAFYDAVLLYILSDGRASFFIRDGNANGIAVTGANPLNNNVWHYIVGVRSEKSALLYVDGVLQACQTNPLLGNINASCKFSWIGGTNTSAKCGSLPTDDRFFTGFVDEFFIVKRDLPGSEIMNLYLYP